MGLLNKVKSKLIHGSFARNVLVMFAGTALGQLCSVLLSPVLTRIYSPELFGLLGFFVAIIGILSEISALCYDLALPLAKTKEEAANLLAVCIASLLFMVTLLSVCLLIIPDVTLTYIFGSLTPYLFFLPVGLFFISLYHIMVGYATQRGAFAVIAKTKIYQGVTGPVSQIGLGVAGAGAWGLMIGFVLGQSAGFLNMLVRLIIKPRDVLEKINLQEMMIVAKRFIRFPLISSWSSLISNLGLSSLIMIVIPLLYSNVITGYIFLTERIIGRPLLLISTSILQVYMGEAAKTQISDPQAMRRRFLQILKGQFVIVSFWLALINATAFYFIPLLFGQEWAEAVIYIHILSICYLPQMIMVAVTHTLQIMEKQGLMAMWEFGVFAVVVAGFTASYIFGLSAVQAIWIYSISQAVMHIILLAMMYQAIQKLQLKTV